MKKGDIIVIIIALLTAGILYFGYQFFNDTDGSRVVVIKVDQEIIKTIELTEDTEIKYLVKTQDGKFIDITETNSDELPNDEYDYNLVYVHDYGVQVTDADCPAKVDVKQGFVKTPNLPIVCIPHKLSVMIETTGETDDEPPRDAISV